MSAAFLPRLGVAAVEREDECGRPESVRVVPPMGDEACTLQVRGAGKSVSLFLGLDELEVLIDALCAARDERALSDWADECMARDVS